MGKLRIAIGPMWGGKTSWLISEIEKAQIVDKKVLVLSPTIDDRYAGNVIASHNGNVFKNADVVKVNKLTAIECEEIAKKYNFIAIDEGQFIEDVDLYALNFIRLNCDVIVSCLSGDYKQQMFQSVSKLIPIADKIHHLNAICMVCKKNKAPFTHRIDSEGGQILIGGKDKYEAVCRACLDSL